MGTVVFVVVLAVAGVAGLFTLLGLLSRSRLDRQEQALVASLTAAGATKKGTKLGTVYEGNEVAFELDGAEVTVNARYESRSLVRVGLLLKSGFLPWAVFSPERGVHRLGKKLGINREVQTGDPAFDHRCYVDSPEDDAVIKRLLGEDAARQAIAGLIDLGFHVQTSTRGVEAFQLAPLGERREVSKAAEATAHLARLAKVVPVFDEHAFKAPHGTRNLPLIVLVVLLTAGSLLGALALESSLTVHVNRTTAMALLIGGGVAVWAAVVALLSIIARGSSDGMRALVASAAITFLGVPALGGMSLLAANHRLDGAPATVHKVTVRSKQGTGSRRSVEVDSWEQGAAPVHVDASPVAYEKLKVGDVASVAVHPGALGFTWVEPLDAQYGYGL